MKRKIINFTTWGKHYSTPYFSLIINDEYYQISFIVLNFHFWGHINRKLKYRK